ncbi:MAG: OmpH family outer membrane protein, partial [Endozoicomonadaceae bacterium]|nr:OmpH family outer membrane protein [Endozoicomonadaceae bacterium]
YQPKLKKLAERRDILNLNKNKLEKSSLIMTAEERTKEEAALQKEESAIIDALNQLRAKKKQEDEQMFEHLELYFDQAVKRVSEAKKLSLVINKHALFYYKDVLDITAEVTREFDHLIKKAETKHSQQNNSSAENDKPEKAKP